MEKAREFQTNIYFCFIDYAKAFDCVDHNKLWKILKDGRKIKSIKLEMKMERSQQTTQKYKKAKWLSEEALQIAVKRREAKSKG